MLGKLVWSINIIIFLKAHQCHFGDCPLCSEVCDKELPCSHRCHVKCHGQVLNENVGVRILKNHLN